MLDVRFNQKLYKEHEATSAFKRYHSKKQVWGSVGGAGGAGGCRGFKVGGSGLCLRFRVWDSTLKPKSCAVQLDILQVLAFSGTLRTTFALAALFRRKARYC